MVGARSTRWLDGVDATGVQVLIEPRHIQRARDESGIFHVNVTADSGLDLNIQIRGRPDESAPWFVIHKFIESDLDQDGSGGAVVALYPQMDMWINKMNGVNPIAYGWLME